MSKPGVEPTSGISSGDVLTERHPACRRREARPGCGVEREHLAEPLSASRLRLSRAAASSATARSHGADRGRPRLSGRQPRERLARR